jgi:uncharacterized protein YndB with AHSA1/START domain
MEEERMSSQPESATQAQQDLVITRIFDAPRALVFKAWTEPKHLARWWGPAGYTTPVCQMDPRAGGDYRFRMQSSEGADVWWHGVCREIIEPERIVWTCALDGANGKRISSETILTVTLDEHPRGTQLTLRQGIFDSSANREGHQRGWDSALARLADHLAAMP